MRKFVMMSLVSPHTGFDLFDADRVTKDCDLFCVVQNLPSLREVDKAWAEYQMKWGGNDGRRS